ncbi:Hypothetical_protein [Hexamita inflata]|uniref:Hypothetical_protein n=1 Tax=Hexamita inflata TaxID=28002 RepID=A0AA86NLD3_9EUKA|nr:Hypothetical protein HINF_LOCUS9654 [Hexamita inflata]
MAIEFQHKFTNIIKSTLIVNQMKLSKKLGRNIRRGGDSNQEEHLKLPFYITSNQISPSWAKELAIFKNKLCRAFNRSSTSIYVLLIHEKHGSQFMDDSSIYIRLYVGQVVLSQFRKLTLQSQQAMEYKLTKYQNTQCLRESKGATELQTPCDKSANEGKRKYNGFGKDPTKQSEMVPEQHSNETSASLHSSIQLNLNEILLSLTLTLQEEIQMELRMLDKTTATQNLRPTTKRTNCLLKQRLQKISNRIDNV